jgi:hypothetical protein
MILSAGSTKRGPGDASARAEPAVESESALEFRSDQRRPLGNAGQHRRDAWPCSPSTCRTGHFRARGTSSRRRRHITRPGGQRSCPRGRPSSRSRTARPSCLQDDAPSSWRAAWPCCGVMLGAWSKGTRVTVIPSSSASFGAISGPDCRKLGQGNGASERAASEQVEPERAHPGAVVVGLPPSWR